MVASGMRVTAFMKLHNMRNSHHTKTWWFIRSIKILVWCVEGNSGLLDCYRRLRKMHLKIDTNTNHSFKKNNTKVKRMMHWCFGSYRSPEVRFIYALIVIKIFLYKYGPILKIIAGALILCYSLAELDLCNKREMLSMEQSTGVFQWKLLITHGREGCTN